VFDTAALATDVFDPTITSSNYIPVSGGGPSGLVLDGAHQRLPAAGTNWMGRRTRDVAVAKVIED